MTTLCIVDVAEDVLYGMIAENSIGNGMDSCAHTSSLGSFFIFVGIASNDESTIRVTNEEEGGEKRHISCSLLRANFFSLVNL